MASLKYITSDGNYWDEYLTDEAILERFTKDYRDACYLYESKLIYSILEDLDKFKYIDEIYDSLCNYATGELYYELFIKSFNDILLNILYYNKALLNETKHLYINKSISNERYYHLGELIDNENLKNFSIKDKNDEDSYIIQIITNLFSIELMFEDDKIILNNFSEISYK